MTREHLPEIVQALAQEHPAVWDAYNKLGEATAQAGPLDENTERLVKLALAVGAGLQGAVHSHTRRGAAAGLSQQELEHVALLAITTVGWPTAVAGLSWIRDELAMSG
jgi:4-carboxymuconolactone decarboxylase